MEKCDACPDGTLCGEKNDKEQTCTCKDIDDDGKSEFCFLKPIRPAKKTCEVCPDGMACGEKNQKNQTCTCKDRNKDGKMEYCFLRPLSPPPGFAQCDKCGDGTACEQKNDKGQSCECKDVNQDGKNEYCFLKPPMPIPPTPPTPSTPSTTMPIKTCDTNKDCYDKLGPCYVCTQSCPTCAPLCMGAPGKIPICQSDNECKDLFEPDWTCWSDGCCHPSGATTTTIAPGTTTTPGATTTSISSPLLTAENLVDCINGKGGTLYTLGTGCLPCIGQKSVFEQETSAPVGPGLQEYDRLNRKSSGSPTGIYPTWSWPAKNKNEMGCLSFTELNTFFECNLAPVSGHQYQSC